MNETHHEDYTLPKTETRHVSELFTYGAADTEALERREAARRADQHQNEQLRSRPVAAGIAAIEEALRQAERSAGIAAIEDALRQAEPNEVVQVPPEYIDKILAERNQQHGEFTDDAKVSQRLKLVMRDARNWDGLNHIQREALEHIATKIGRILSGDPNHEDHWKDIQGYARLVETRL